MVREKEIVVVADDIWDDIKARPIEMFALSNQKVEHHVTKLDVPVKNQLYVKLSSSAVLPSLEASLSDYDVEAAEKYVIIKRRPEEISVNENG